MSIVSILVPIYNVEKYIKRCLISLFEQNFSSIEYVFVNDASTDNSMNILYQTINDYPERISQVKIVNHECNRGLAATRRTAVENATSPFILHVDSDDYIDVNLVSLMYDKILTNGADVVVGDIVIEYPHKQTKLKAVSCGDKWNYLSMMLTRKVPCNIWGKLFRRDIVIDNSIFAHEGINQGEDYQVTPRIIYYAQKICYAEVSYYYNQKNELSYTKNMTTLGIYNIIKAQEVLNAFFQSKREISKDIIEESCIYNKLTLISVAKYDEYPIIASLYSDIDYGKYDFKIGHKIVLKLLKKRQFRLVYSIIFTFKVLFRWK